MADFFWSTQNPNGQDVRCEGGEIVKVTPKSMSAIAGDAGNFVWKPGAVQQGNVYNNWPDLAAAIAALPGQKTVTVDTSLGAAHVTTGNWPFILDTKFVAGGGTGVIAAITIDDGAHFTYASSSEQEPRLSFDGINVGVANTAAAVISLTTQALELFFDNASALIVTGSKAFVSMAGTSELVCWVKNNSIVSTGSADPFVVTGGTPVLDFIAVTGAILQQSIIAATGGAGTVAWLLDASAQTQASTAQSIAPVVTVFDPQETFVLQPGGGSADKNVFGDWTSMYLALAMSPHQPRTVLIDDNFAPAHMVSGTWELDNVTLLVNFGSAGAGVLIVDNGAHISSDTHTLTIADGLIVRGDAAIASTVWAPAGGGLFTQLIFRNAGALQNSSATPFITVTDNNFSITGFDTIVGDSTHPVVTVAAGKSVSAVLSDSNIAAHAFAGLGTLNAFCDPASLVITPQDVSTVTVSKSAVTGMLVRTTVSKTGNYTLTSGAVGGSPDYTVWADTNGGALTITLPTPAAGLQFLIVDSGNHSGAAAITLARHAAEKINGAAANLALATNGAAWLVTTNGTDWWVNKMVIGP